MKRIITPKVETPEVATYSCDVTGTEMGRGSAATLEIRCGFGSKRDMIIYHLDLCDAALDDLMVFLRSRIYPRKLKDVSVERRFDGDSEFRNDHEFEEDKLGAEVVAMFPKPNGSRQ